MAYAPGKGTELRLTITGTPTAIAQLVSVTPPSMEMGTTETTHLGSTWKEYISNIPDGGEVSFVVEYATHAALWTAFTGGAAEVWAVAFNDAGDTTVGFSGILTAFAWDDVVVDGVVTASLTVKVTGAVTITP
jgi:hypothetical protein